MTAFLKWLWDREPALVTLLGSAAFWPALFALLSSFGHGLTSTQETAVAGFAILLAGYIIRSNVVPVSGVTQPLSVDLSKRPKNGAAVWLLPLLLVGTLGSSCAHGLSPTTEAGLVAGLNAVNDTVDHVSGIPATDEALIDDAIAGAEAAIAKDTTGQSWGSIIRALMTQLYADLPANVQNNPYVWGALDAIEAILGTIGA